MKVAGPSGTLPDLLFICAVVTLSAVLYTGGLGFYSDDWSIIAYFQSGRDGSLWEILTLGFKFLPFRPGQIAHLGVLYWAFGTEPLGYHISNVIMLMGASALFYLVLRELAQPRLIAVSVPLLFILLPHYATVRFWAATFAGSLAMVTYLLSVYADLRVVRPGGAPAAAWKIAALAALAASIATYETFLPFLVATPLLVWYRCRLGDAVVRLSFGRLAVGFVPNALLIAALVLFKMQVDYRYVPTPVIQHIEFFTKLLGSAVRSAVVEDFGLRLPWTLQTIAREFPNRTVYLVALLAGGTVFAYLLRLVRSSPDALAGGRRMLQLCAAGAVIYVAGYAIFLTNFNAAITTTGPNNRTGMAAAIGLAMFLVGLTGWLCGLLPRGWVRDGFFSGTMALLAATGVLIVNTVGTFWMAAASRQMEVLADIKMANPGLADGTTLLIDGLCRYMGPAPVFETWWDMSGALRILYGNQTLVGDVVTPTLRIEEDGIYTTMYGQKHGPYAYENLLIYDAKRNSTAAISGPFAAASYLRQNDPQRDSGCLPAAEGYGESVF